MNILALQVVLNTPLPMEFGHLRQRVKPPVVHIGGCHGDIAQVDLFKFLMSARFNITANRPRWDISLSESTEVSTDVPLTFDPKNAFSSRNRRL